MLIFSQILVVGSVVTILSHVVGSLVVGSLTIGNPNFPYTLDSQLVLQYQQDMPVLCLLLSQIFPLPYHSPTPLELICPLVIFL